MKHLFSAPIVILFLVVFFTQNGFSQDRIVLASGDTIHCKISRITQKYLFYSQDFNGVSAKGKILKTNIREWTYFAAKEELPNEPEVLLPTLSNENQENAGVFPLHPDYGKIRFSVNGGLAYLLGNTKNAELSLQDQGVTAANAKKYYDNLKLGLQTKASVYFHLRGEYWLGVLYNGFYTRSNIISTMQMDETNMYYGNMGEHYFVNFAGASFFSAARYGSKSQFGFNSSFSVGPAFYRDEVEMLNEQVLIQAVSLGSNLSLGMEYFIKPKLSVGLETSLFSCQVKKMKVTTAYSSRDVELDKENYENLGRLDISLGIVYYW